MCHDGMGIMVEATCAVAVACYHDAASIHTRRMLDIVGERERG